MSKRKEMISTGAAKKLGSIAFVLDDRLSREKAGILTRITGSMRQFAQVQTFPGNTHEDELLGYLELHPFQLVFAPWHLYLKWSRVEGLYGLTRTSGPTFVGYFSEKLHPSELGELGNHMRAILMDFNHLGIHEIMLLVRSLLDDKLRYGMKPLIRPATPIYCENWYANHGLGHRIDSVLTLPELTQNDWGKRANAIRSSLCAFWSLIYDDGPGKSEFSQAVSPNSPRGYFQVAADSRVLVLRLSYVMPNWTPRRALDEFWPDEARPTSGAQTLRRYADFVRVHTVVPTSEIEIVAGFFNSAPAERAFDELHSLWIEPISESLVTETAYEAPGPSDPQLKPLPGPSARPKGEKKPVGLPATASSALPDRFVKEAATRIRELRTLLHQRDEYISELKNGGVGAAAQIAPPDAEALIEAFQERYFEARYRIRQFELQIADLEKGEESPDEIQSLRQQMDALINREEAWVKKMSIILDVYRESKKKVRGDQS